MGWIDSVKFWVLFCPLLFLIACSQSDELLRGYQAVAVTAKQFNDNVPDSLTHFQDHVMQYPMIQEGSEMNILIIEADSPRTAETIIFFNGLSQVIPDWPPLLIELLVGKYNLLFMDYPGIGGTHPFQDKDFNFLNIANNINKILDSFPDKYTNIVANRVHFVAWSLGTLVALKSITPLSQKRQIKNVILFSTKPGGEGETPLGTAFGNTSPCVKSTVAELSQQGKDWYAHLARRLKQNVFELLFPYKGQAIVDSSSAYMDCTVSDQGEVLQVGISPELSHQYDKIGWLFLKNRLWGLWHGGIPHKVFNQQRQAVSDWDRLSELGEHYHISRDSGNDAICQTRTLTKNRVLSVCPDLSTKVEHIKVIHAKKDLFIQYRFGQSLVDALNTASPKIASLDLFDDAGHGYFLQVSYQLTPFMFE
ncbi:hypothetical protein [uncultured Shewanella sp.]|uniref:alpha/beta fold hydrolase n=1 Tax=uncultured Shewanella sp. TaxID=173975 RepID=UPI0026252B65|nr:hypothetical protein [uncultured Shewanella sp.]